MNITLFRSDLARLLEALGSTFVLRVWEGVTEHDHVSRPYRELLADEPERQRLERAVEEVLTELRELTDGDSKRQRPCAPAVPERQLETQQRRYVLRGAGLPTASASAPGVAALVAVTTQVPQPLDEETLRRRFRFTSREAQVARLLALGNRNREIAAALGIRPSTAHHYTEGVLLKMGLHNRAKVGAKILRPES